MKEEWNDLQFEIYGANYSVKEIENLSLDHQKRFEEIIENYYRRIRTFLSGGRCTSRSYDYIKSHLDYDCIKQYLKELTNDHIDFIIFKIKELFPYLP